MQFDLCMSKFSPVFLEVHTLEPIMLCLCAKNHLIYLLFNTAAKIADGFYNSIFKDRETKSRLYFP